MAQLLSGFDVDCCGVSFDGTDVVCLPRTRLALNRRANVVDAERWRSKSFEYRLFKYSLRGFGVLVPGFQRNRVNPDVVRGKYGATSGLGRLLQLEAKTVVWASQVEEKGDHTGFFASKGRQCEVTESESLDITDVFEDEYGTTARLCVTAPASDGRVSNEPRSHLDALSQGGVRYFHIGRSKPCAILSTFQKGSSCAQPVSVTGNATPPTRHKRSAW